MHALQKFCGLHARHLLLGETMGSFREYFFAGFREELVASRVVDLFTFIGTVSKLSICMQHSASAAHLKYIV